MVQSRRSGLTLCSHARWTAAVLPNQTPRMSQIQQTLTASAPREAQRGRQNPRVGSRTRPPDVGASAHSWIFRRITREVSLVVLAIFSFASSLVAQPYTPPANERVDVILDPGWRFIRQDVAGAQNSKGIERCDDMAVKRHRIGFAAAIGDTVGRQPHPDPVRAPDLD